MNTVSTVGLTVKVSRSTAGVSDFIKAELNAIPKGEGLAMIDLVKAVMTLPTVPTKHQAYTRINNVLSRKFGDKFIKLVDESGYTYIAWKTEEVK